MSESEPIHKESSSSSKSNGTFAEIIAGMDTDDNITTPLALSRASSFNDDTLDFSDTDVITAEYVDIAGFPHSSPMKGFSRDKDNSGAGASAQVLLSWKNSLQSSSSSAQAGRKVGGCLSDQENGFANGVGLQRSVDALSSGANRLHTEKRRRAGGSHEGGSRATLGLTDEALWELEMGTEDQYAFEHPSYSKPIKSPNLVELSSQWDRNWENDEDDEENYADYGNLELIAGRPRTMTGGSSSDDQSIASLSSGLDSITLDALMEVGSNFCEDISMQTVNDDASDAMSRGTSIEVDATKPNIMQELLQSKIEDTTKEIENEKKINRGKYKCGRCGQPKQNHICPFELVANSCSVGTQVSGWLPGIHPFSTEKTLAMRARDIYLTASASKVKSDDTL